MIPSLSAMQVHRSSHPPVVQTSFACMRTTAMTSPTIVSRPHPTVWQITLSSPPDNRLTPTLLRSLSSNLDTVEAEWRRSGGGVHPDPKNRGQHGGAGALILTSDCGKFFSNGLDWEASLAVPNFFESEDLLLSRLIFHVLPPDFLKAK